MWDSRRGRGEGLGHLIDRRSFLARSALGGLALLAWPIASPARAGHHEKAEGAALAPETLRLLEKSGFVYVSPLRSDGAESTCHGEVWYGWIDGGVVLITSKKAWKSQALDRGLDRARIWVGDHGRWKKLLGRNEEFRKAPSFDARATVVEDVDVLERLLAGYETKYPAEIADWRDKMRNGFHDGTRVLIKYTPA